jgi:hypothetical protein
VRTLLGVGGIVVVQCVPPISRLAFASLASRIRLCLYALAGQHGVMLLAVVYSTSG